MPITRNIIEKRLYADEYNQRNKLLLEEINQRIKEQAKLEDANDKVTTKK